MFEVAKLCGALVQEVASSEKISLAYQFLRESDLRGVPGGSDTAKLSLEILLGSQCPL
jgi:hypothetical protein